ncbi:dihydrodipicolinate synthase family protein [uncultured Robinsoniella sp.]|uniref:dihydrodipicolinate synthase family protein n=1 Tax=uncultured Robinsoniella sp. TaxID=904190 RepID=UPI00374F95E3
MSKYDVSRFKNVTVALNTPFTASGDIDLDAAKKLTRYYIKKGVKSLYVCGSTGEGFLLDSSERKKVVEAVTQEAGDEMTIIVHVGCADTRHSADLAKHAKEAGADGTSAVPSVYYHVSEESVYRHWTAITEAADLPFFIYNIPQLTGFNLSMGLFNRMLENERVAGVKCSSDPCHDILRFKQAGGEDFIVFNGPDEQFLAGRLMGADAAIGGTYGAMPELYLKLDELIRRGDIPAAQKLQVMVTMFIYRLCSFPSMYGACKTIIRMDGVNIGDPRLPFLPVDEKDPEIRKLYEDIRAAVEETKCW